MFNKSYTCFKHNTQEIGDVSCWTPIAATPAMSKRTSQDVDAPTLCMQMGDDDMEEDVATCSFLRSFWSWKESKPQ